MSRSDEESYCLAALRDLMQLYPSSTASYRVKYNWARSILDEGFRKQRVATISACTARKLTDDEDYRSARNARMAARNRERYKSDEEYRERRRALSAASRATKKSNSPLVLEQ